MILSQFTQALNAQGIGTRLIVPAVKINSCTNGAFAYTGAQIIMPKSHLTARTAGSGVAVLAQNFAFVQAGGSTINQFGQGGNCQFAGSIDNSDGALALTGDPTVAADGKMQPTFQ